MSWGLFYELYHEALDHRGDLFDGLLMPWLDRAGEALRWLGDFGRRKGEPWPPATPDDLEILYIAYRLNELLLLAFQSGPHEPREGLPPSLLRCHDEYATFMTLLGFRVVSVKQFDPFFHEIVRVEPGESFEVVRELWPCLMLGDMLFSRAGCVVRVPPGVDPAVAERSVMHWASVRRHRPAHDLGIEWGHNSQWRTDFRRDYWRGDRFGFNVDGEHHVGDPRSPFDETDGDDEPDFPLHVRIELLTHRCFVHTRPPNDEHQWVYDYTWVRHAGSPSDLLTGSQ